MRAGRAIGWGMAAGLAAMGAAMLHAAPTSAEAEVLAVEQARLQAMRDGDIAALDRITAEDYVHVESTGQKRTKAQFLDGFRDREYRFVSFEIDENSVQLMGRVAVVTGRYRNVIETPAGVQPEKHARHIRVYERRGGAWINVSHQATAIADPA